MKSLITKGLHKIGNIAQRERLLEIFRPDRKKKSEGQNKGKKLIMKLFFSFLAILLHKNWN